MNICSHRTICTAHSKKTSHINFIAKYRHRNRWVRFLLRKPLILMKVTRNFFCVCVAWIPIRRYGGYSWLNEQTVRCMHGNVSGGCGSTSLVQQITCSCLTSAHFTFSLYTFFAIKNKTIRTKWMKMNSTMTKKKKNRKKKQRSQGICNK